MRRSTKRWAAVLGVLAASAAVGIGPVRAAPPDPTYEVSTEFDQYQLNDIVNYEGTCYPAGAGAGQSAAVTIRVYAVATGDYPGDLTGGTGVEPDGSFSGWIQLAANIPDGIYRLEASCYEQQGPVVQVAYSADFTIGAVAPTTTSTPTTATTTPGSVPVTGLPADLTTTTAPPAGAPAQPATATSGSPSYTG